jgi:hypothetical protein
MRVAARRCLAAATIAAALTLILAGCGGGGGGGGDSADADRYRAQADTICRRFEEQTAALGSPASSEEAPAFLDEGITITRDRLEELQALEPPEELRAAHDAAMDLLAEQIATLEELLEAINGGEAPDAAAARLAPELDRLESEVADRARELGLTTCAGDPPADGGTTTADGGGTTTTAATTTGTTTAAPQTLEPEQLDRYLDDVRTAAAALNRFGAALRASSSVTELRARAGGLSDDVETFEQAIARMRAYRIAIPPLERQRAAMVEEGDEVAAQLGDFADAAAVGDTMRIQDLIPGARAAVDRLGEAAEAASQG